MNINSFGAFESDVWGTVSDWAMVVVTTLTAVFLIKTFKSQKKVQILQQSITDIENERYRIEYRPKFEITPINIGNSTIGEGMRSTVHFKLKLIENDAREVEVIGKGGISQFENISISKNHNGFHMPISTAYFEDEYDLYFNLLPNAVLFPTEGSYFFFSLNFKDAIGNVYSQLFTTVFKDTFLSFSPSNAERIIIDQKKKNVFQRILSSL